MGTDFNASESKFPNRSFQLPHRVDENPERSRVHERRPSEVGNESQMPFADRTLKRVRKIGCRVCVELSLRTDDQPASFLLDSNAVQGSMIVFAVC